MSDSCAHHVGYIPPEDVSVEGWNDRLIAFVAKVDDFNVRGQRVQIPHPGFISEFKFCPNCGQKIDRQALGLLSYPDAFDQFLKGKSSGGQNA